MKKDNMTANNNTADNLGPTIAPTINIDANSPIGREIAELQLKLYKAQLNKIEREETEVLQQQLDALRQEQRRAEMMRRDAEVDEKKRVDLKRAQEMCKHTCGNMGQSVVRGQRLGGGKNYIICQFCLKEWDDWSQVPAQLHIHPEYYGGPIGY